MRSPAKYSISGLDQCGQVALVVHISTSAVPMSCQPPGEDRG